MLKKTFPRIEAGDRFKTIPLHKKERPKHGKVTDVVWHNPKNPIEEHGTVTVMFDDGQEEHYCHSNWFQFLKIVKE